MGWIYDRVREGEYECADLAEGSLIVSVQPERIRRATVVHAGEALDYYSFGTPTQDLIGDESIYATDFPTLSPPFTTFFIEHGWTDDYLLHNGDRAPIDEFHWEAGLWHYGCLCDWRGLVGCGHQPASWLGDQRDGFLVLWGGGLLTPAAVADVYLPVRCQSNR